MFNVMIVDDEDIVRDDLKHLINWNEMGYQIVTEARNGLEALHQYRKYRPHLIITDIKMPVMDGIELSRQISHETKKTKIIFLTAYGDFEYAKKAIQMGVHSYLLKHELDGELLVAELNKMKKYISDELEYSLFEKKRTLLKLLKDSSDERLVRSFISKYNVPIEKGRTFLAVAELDFSTTDPADRTNAAFPVFSDQKWAELFFEPEHGHFQLDAVQIDENRFICFVNVNGLYSYSEMNYRIQSLFSSLQKRIQDMTKRTVSISLCGPVQRLTDIRALYEKAVRQLSLKMFTKGEAFLKDEMIPNVSEKVRETCKNYVAEMEKCLECNDFQTADQIAAFLFTEWLVQHRSPDLLKYCLDELLGVLYNHLLNKPAISKKWNRNIHQICDEVFNLRSVYHIYRWFSDFLSGMTEQNQYSGKIKKALMYIHEHYDQKDLTLEKIAEYLQVSPIYISQLFKKEVGDTFRRYLTKYRIQKAVALLESGNYKVYEVSDMVGYQTVQYFCRVFKKITGKNPADYEK